MAWTAVISALVTITLFVVLNFLLVPQQEKRKARQEQLNKLYAPVYGLLLAQLEIGKNASVDRIILGGYGGHDFLTKLEIDKMIYDNLGYASSNLIEAWAPFSARGKLPVSTELQENLVMVVVKDYNELKKQLRLPYNAKELKTGIPEIVKYLRDKHGEAAG